MMKLKKGLSFCILLFFAVLGMADSNEDSNQKNNKASMELFLKYAAANKDNHGEQEISDIFVSMTEYVIALVKNQEDLKKEVAQLRKENSRLITSIVQKEIELNVIEEINKPNSEEEDKGSMSEVASTEKQEVVASLEKMEPEVVTSRKLVAPSLFEGDGKNKTEITFTPAVVNGRVNLLNSTSTGISVRAHELFVGLMDKDYSVKLHKAYTLYVDKNPSEICNGDKGNSQPGTENNTCSYQHELIQLLASYNDHGKTSLFLDRGDDSNNYYHYICDQDISKSLNITTDSILKCKYVSDNHLPLTNETVNTSQNREPSNLLKTVTYAAYLKKRSNQKQQGVTIDYDVPTSYQLYSKNVTEEEYNHQILSATSYVAGYSLNTEQVNIDSITNDELKKAEEDLDATRYTLNKCKNTNLNHDARIHELREELDSIKKELNSCT